MKKKQEMKKWIDEWMEEQMNWKSRLKWYVDIKCEFSEPERVFHKKRVSPQEAQTHTILLM